MSRRRKYLVRGAGEATPAEWQTVYSASPNTAENGWGTAGIRTVVPAASLSDITGTQIRVTFEALASAFQPLAVTNVFVGHQAGAGDNYDMDGGQVRLTFSAANGFSIAGGNTILSDEIPFSFDGTKALVLSVDHDATSQASYLASGGTAMVFKLPSANEAGVSDVTGYASVGGAFIGYISKIEVFG